ncbi:MAG: hypothetical protein K2N50_01285 [Clostridia bacterium]|nr:hypothetical protein [Clostridia bacterium]
MKKNKKSLPQLNKSSALKLFIFVAIIILIEVAAGLFIFSQFSSKTYKQEYAAFSQKANSLTEKINTEFGDSIGDGFANDGNAALRAGILEQCKAVSDFDCYIIFSDSGRIIEDGGMELSDSLGNYGLKYNASAKVSIGGVNYVFVPSAIGDSGYRIGCFKDFTERQKIIDNLLGNMVGTLIAAGVLIVADFVIFAYMAGNREKADRFKYKVTIDKTGKILHANGAFKHEFATTSKIDEPEKLDKKSLSLVSLSGNYGDRLVAMRISAQPKRSVVYAADIVNADAFIQSGENIAEFDSDGKTTASLSKVF